MPEPIRTIVVGVEDVGGPDPLLELALRIARGRGVTVHLVHSYTPPDTAQGLGLGGMDYTGLAGVTPVWGGAEAWDLAGALEERLQAQVHAHGGHEAVHLHVIPGSASSAIRDVAEEAEADLVVVGASRRGSLERAVLGTTTGSVLRDSFTPVLVVRNPFPHTAGRVLLTTDLTGLSRAVCSTGLAISQAILGPDPISFACLHVRTDGLQEDPESGSGSAAASRADLRRFVDEIAPPGTRVEPLLRAGVPVHEIRSVADEWGADLVVLGTHARKGVARFFLGSVAATAVREVTRNALVVPPFAE
jgi:universal stress protein E